MLIDAVIPLLLTHGRSVTTRQIAQEAGIAEGTIFRAFGDKESLVQAAITKHLDPTALRQRLAAIDPALPLEQKVAEIVELMLARFEQVFGFMAALGEVGRPPSPDERLAFQAVIAGILQPDLERLNLSTERVAQFIRLVTFASSIPQFNRTIDFDSHDLTALILTGIAGQQSPTATTE
jgi:AcrR family transcriptional regulator